MRTSPVTERAMLRLWKEWFMAMISWSAWPSLSVGRLSAAFRAPQWPCTTVCEGLFHMACLYKFGNSSPMIGSLWYRLKHASACRSGISVLRHSLDNDSSGHFKIPAAKIQISFPLRNHGGNNHRLFQNYRKTVVCMKNTGFRFFHLFIHAYCNISPHHLLKLQYQYLASVKISSSKLCGILPSRI